MEKDTITLEEKHAGMVNLLAKDPGLLMDEMTRTKADLNHAIIGIAGEVGEFAEFVEIVEIREHPVDRDNLVEEMGDMEFYLQQLRHRAEIKREDVFSHTFNVDKD